MTQKPVAEDGPRGAGESPARGRASGPEVREAQGGTEEAGRTSTPEVADKQAAEQAADQVSEDLDELTATRRERDEYLELAQRTRADFDNYRKRVAKEASEALARGRATLARDLIPVLDNLERALKAAGVDPDDAAATSPGEAPSEGVSAQEPLALARGVALVSRELRSALEGAGVQAYDPVGERFDPAWHEALSTRAAEGTEPGIVVETLERGYRLDGQVLRPARVVVSE
jgi:molecular chaperone GrpE